MADCAKGEWCIYFSQDRQWSEIVACFTEDYIIYVWMPLYNFLQISQMLWLVVRTERTMQTWSQLLGFSFTVSRKPKALNDFAS